MTRKDYEIKLRERVRMQHKSNGTADAYWHWVNRFLDFNLANKIGKETKAEAAVEKFLTHIANRECVSANTQNQAFSALCYFYRDVLGRELVGVSALRAKRPDRIADICDTSEIALLLNEMTGVNRLIFSMLYGCILRSSDLAAVRLKDLDFNRKQLKIWDAKGAKSRLVPFPTVLHDDVNRQIESVKCLWRGDVADGLNGVSLPDAWGRKSPSSHLDLPWFYLFPADNYSKHPVTGKLLRHHRDTSTFSKALKAAVRSAGILKRITPHCLRHSGSTHAIENGMNVLVLKEILGHSDITTTMTYIHLSKEGITSAKSPLESLLENPQVGVGLRAANNHQCSVSPQLRVYAG